MLRRVFLSVTAATAAFALAGYAGEKLKSGLEVGDSPAPFDVRDVTGPQAGESLCYRCKYGSKPVVNIFTRSMSDELVALVKEVDKKVSNETGLCSFVVVLTEDADKTEADLKAVAKKAEIKNVPLTYIEGAAGPKAYNIAKDAEVTIHLWVDSDNKATFAYEKGKFDKAAAKAVLAELPKILEKKG